MYIGLKVFISVLYSKKMKVLESLIGMIQKFPYDDPTYDKLHEDLDKIRGKFKQVCPLLLFGRPAFSTGAGVQALGAHGTMAWGCKCLVSGQERRIRFCVLVPELRRA